MNSPASVRARLLNASKQSGEAFQATLTRFAIERFLYRLGISDQRDSFILKGAILFVAWEGTMHRPTKDLDFLGSGSSALQDVALKIREIAGLFADDGIVFDPESVATEVIKEDAEYEGVRALVIARLEQARISLQIDVGFGDAVEPPPIEGAFPTILKEIAPPLLLMYPPEVVIAEKLHAMIILDIRNSRMKDFYDIWHLARNGSFQLSTLQQAIAATFDRRRTKLPTEIPFALTHAFLVDESKTLQWRGFLKRLQLEASAPDLPEVGRLIAKFLNPVWTGSEKQLTWQQGGPWRE